MTTSPSPLRMGVIGVGVVGKAHARRFRSENSPVELAAIADESHDAASALAAELEVDVAASVDDLLSRDDIDGVVVAVPSGLHADVAVPALDAGKHVLLEKPLEVTVEAGERIIDAEKRSGKVLSVVSQRRFAPPNQFLHHTINAGGLGRITSANIEIALWRSQEYYDSNQWRGTWALDGGGALLNQGVHLVDLALWLLGDVEEVYAHSAQLAHERIEVEDVITITARLRSGALLTFLASTATHGDLPLRMAIMGEGGTTVTLSEKFTHFATHGELEVPEFEPVDIHLAQLNDFVTAVKEGTPPLVTSAQARAALSFIEAAYTSARTGRPVKPQ